MIDLSWFPNEMTELIIVAYSYTNSFNGFLWFDYFSCNDVCTDDPNGNADNVSHCGRRSDVHAPVSTTPGPIRSWSQRVRTGFRLWWCRTRTSGRGAGRTSGHSRQQDGALRGHADDSRLRTVRCVQTGPISVRGRVVPTGRTAAQVQPGREARAHSSAQIDSHRTIRVRAQDLRWRSRARAYFRARAQAARVCGDPGPVALLRLSASRPQVVCGGR